MKILLVCPQQDKQSGLYIHNALIELGNKIATLDNKEVLVNNGPIYLNQQLLEAVKVLTPDVTLIIKGLGFTSDTIKKCQEIHPHKMIGWIFDVTLGGTLVQDVPQYVDFIKSLDTFYTIDMDAIEPLKSQGVNAKWISEGCHIPEHKEQVFNSYQAKKYGADIVFLGAVGSIHPNREKLLKRIADEGFNFKIYGEVLYPEGTEPEWVKNCHTGYGAINDSHSIVCQSSKIVIGIDGWPERRGSWSARVYRTLCPGGFLLTTKTKGMDEVFKPGIHLDYFTTEDDLIEKINEYLMDDERRNTIANAGKELVQNEHTFKCRLQEILQEAKAKDLNT